MKYEWKSRGQYPELFRKKVVMLIMNKTKVVTLDAETFDEIRRHLAGAIGPATKIIKLDKIALLLKEEGEEMDTPEYVQGFKDGHNGKYNPVATELIFCGYTLDKLYEIIQRYEMDKVEPEQEAIEKPMTKLQAIDKVSAAVGFKFGTDEERVNSDALIEALEALGLIKFDEPEKVRPWSHSKKEPEKGKYIFFPHPDGNKDNVGVLLLDVIMTLTKCGYHVIPNK